MGLRSVNSVNIKRSVLLTAVLFGTWETARENKRRNFLLPLKLDVLVPSSTDNVHNKICGCQNCQEEVKSV